MRFCDLGLMEPLLKALQDVGYQNPSPIQEKAIPPVLQRRDLLGCAQTGTGKTAAFALPLLQVYAYALTKLSRYGTTEQTPMLRATGKKAYCARIFRKSISFCVNTSSRAQPEQELQFPLQPISNTLLAFSVAYQMQKKMSNPPCELLHTQGS